MKKRIKIISILLCVALVLSLLAPAKVQAVKNTGGVYDRVVELTRLFPAGSFFTVNGLPCSHGSYDTCNNCSLAHIVQREDLRYLNYQRDRDFTQSWTCVAFARFAYRFIYGEKCSSANYSKVYSGTPNQTTFSYAKTGDLLIWDGKVWSASNQVYVATHHEGIYIDSDSTTATTYDGNNGTGSTVQNKTAIVHYGRWTYANMLSYYGSNCTVTIYRANNYDAVNGQASTDYTVTFNANGGSCGTSSIKVAKNSVIGNLPTPTKAGYIFAGWYPSVNGNYDPVSSSYVVTGDITLYAHWANKIFDGYLVQFDANGGSAPSGAYASYTVSGANRKRNDNELIIYTCADQQIDTPTEGGELQINNCGQVVFIRYWGDTNHYHVPEGGFMLSGCGDALKAFENISVGDYVSYSAAENKVYYFHTYEDFRYFNSYRRHGEKMGDLPTPTKPGYDFAGWCPSVNGNYAPVTPDTVVTENITLHAHWANQIYKGYHVQFDAHGGNAPAAYASHSISNYNSWRDYDYLTVFTCGGQQIDTNPFGHELQISDAGQVVFKRYWGDENHYHVPDGGFLVSGHGEAAAFLDGIPLGDYVCFSTSQNMVYFFHNYEDYKYHNTRLQPGQEIGALPTTSKSGYDFAGWYTNENGGGDPVTSSMTVDNNMTLHAHWANRLYSGNHIQFDAQGGQFPGADASHSLTGFNEGRGTAELVVYNCGNQLLATNEWGVEAAVDGNGKVVQRRELFSTEQLTVPGDGFVLSGHLWTGTDAADFVNGAQIGSYVGYDRNTMTAYRYSSQDAYLANHKYYTAGNECGALPAPTWKYHAFQGWYSEPNGGGTKIDENTVLYWDADLILYAYWTIACGDEHDYQYTVTKSPTAYESGTLTGVCSRCNDSTTVSLPWLDTPEYTKTTVKAATCTAAGTDRYTWKTTTYGTFYFDVTTPATGHAESEWIVDLEPTCTAGGLKHTVCTTCGEMVTTEAIPAPGHSWNAGTVVTEPTPTTPGMKIYICTRCMEVRTETIPATGSNPTNPFIDVKESDWFYSSVLWAVENGITSGTSANTFSPGLVCSRSQVVTFLWRAAGKPEPQTTTNPFTDVKTSDYFYKAVLWAVENNITSGVGGGQFGSLTPCSRSQVVTFLWRAAGKPEPQTTTNPFTDVKTSDYFYKAVLWAVENGITSGMGGSSFGSNGDCTRSQVVAFLMRYTNTLN